METSVVSLRSRGVAAAASGSGSAPRVATRPVSRLRTCRQRRCRRQQTPPVAAAAAASNDDLFSDLEPPDVDGDIASAYADAGARFDPTTGVATTFNGNDQQALDAASHAAAVVDRSHCRRLRVSGRGRLAFLHGQATNDFGGSGLVEYGGSGVAPPAPGDVVPDVVFALPDGRVRDFATAFVTPDGILLQSSPRSQPPGSEGRGKEERRGLLPGERAEAKDDPDDLLAALERVAFPGDEVAISDVTAETASFALLGPGAASALAALGAPDAGALPRGKMMMLGSGGGGDGGGRRPSSPVLVARGGGLSREGDGFTLVLDRSSAPDLWRALVSVAGAVPMGESAWERARVVAGRPRVGAEVGASLPTSATALEAGLCDAVSVRKGCYVGQEAFSKVVNVAGRTKRQLWGLRLACEGEEEERLGREALVVGASLWPASGSRRESRDASSSGPPAGRVTSVADDADGKPFALALVSSTGRAGAEKLEEGLEVDVEFSPPGRASRDDRGDVDVVRRARATLVDLPFASRDLPERSSPSGGEEDSGPASSVTEVEPNERGGREARLAAMKARLDAYTRQQQQ